MKRNKVLFTIIMLCIICVISSCQKTPQSKVINQKSYKALLETAEDDFVPEYPDTYTNSFMSRDKNVSIVFDAKVMVPDAQKYPVILVDPKPFTDEMIELAVNEFMGDSVGYYPDKSMTKQEVEAKLVELKLRQNDVDGLYEKYGDETQVNAALGNIKNFIEKYTAMLETAPESKEQVRSFYNFRTDNFYGTDDYDYISNELNMTQEELDERELSQNEPLYLVSDYDLDNGEYIRMYAYNEPPAKIGDLHNFGMHCMEHYEVQIVWGNAPFIEKFDYVFSSAHPFNSVLENGSLDANYPELTISLAEAEAMARQAMSNIGLEDYYLAHSRIEKQMPTHEESTAFWEKVMANPDTEVEDIRETKPDIFYMLTFKPIYYGIPYMNANNRFSQGTQENVLFAFEEVKVRVANDSIAEFRWINPMDVSQVINDNARLLPFDEIIRIAENHMKLKYQLATVCPVHPEMENYEEELAKYISADIKITDIRLGLSGVHAYNNTDEFMLVPAWCFYGTFGYESTERSHKGDYVDYLTPFVSINAVDGSVIEQYSWQDYN